MSKIVQAVCDKCECGGKVYLTEISTKIVWYIPVQYIEAVRRVMGDIDLDPCTDEVVQKRIKSLRYFTKETNGLDKDWFGKVWVNPPYHPRLMQAFAEKTIKEWKSGRLDQVIFNTHTVNTYADYFYELGEICSAACFHKGRIPWDAGHMEIAEELAEMGMIWDPHHSVHGSAFFYMGHNIDNFKRTFQQFGFVMGR